MIPWYGTSSDKNQHQYNPIQKLVHKSHPKIGTQIRKVSVIINQ